MESKLSLFIFSSFFHLSPVFAQRQRSIEDITVDEWLAIAAFTLVFVGIVACTWIVVLWCICRELTYRKNERQRKRRELSRSPENRSSLREQSQNTSVGIIPPISARLEDSQNGVILQATPYRQLPVMSRPETPQQRTNHTDLVSIRTPNPFLNVERDRQLLTRSTSQGQEQRMPTERHQLPHRSLLAPTSITHQPIPRAVITSSRSQLQSLREAEETDVPPDVCEGPPRYKQLFPGTVNDSEDTAFQRPKTYTSPFNFESPPRKGEGERSLAHERSEFSQLNSWPVFQ